MANQENEITKNQQSADNNPGTTEQSVPSQSEQRNTDRAASGNDGQIADKQHNTGNDRMAVDEEGAEVGPDDEV